MSMLFQLSLVKTFCPPNETSPHWMIPFRRVLNPPFHGFANSKHVGHVMHKKILWRKHHESEVDGVNYVCYTLLYVI